MARYFNTAGPCDPRLHYTVESNRCSGDMGLLIERGQYFVLHAARQSGAHFDSLMERDLNVNTHNRT